MSKLKKLLTDVVHVSFETDKCERAAENLQTIIGLVKIIDLENPVELINGIHDYILSNKFERDVNAELEVLHDLADCLVSLQCYFEQIELDAPNSYQILEYCATSLDKLVSPQDNKADMEVSVGDEISLEQELDVLPDLQEFGRVGTRD